MTVPSLREKMVDSIVDSFDAIGTDPADNYWLDYNVARYSIQGETQSTPLIVVALARGDASGGDTGNFAASIGLEFLVKVSHDLERFPGFPPETETDRLIERVITDVQRSYLRWIELDPLGLSPILEAMSWDVLEHVPGVLLLPRDVERKGAPGRGSERPGDGASAHALSRPAHDPRAYVDMEQGERRRACSHSAGVTV